jgi:protein-S-isoprenylcysteine O-methyltransferase Ste14
VRDVRSKAGPLAGSAVFFVLAPGTIAGWIPYMLTRWRFQPAFLGLPVLRIAGAVMLLAGLSVLVDSFLRFALEGHGTPAPVVPPEQLVVTGLYRHVRNPMYVAVLLIIAGQALLFGSLALVAYAAVAWLAFHTFVLLYEEPTLRRRFGASYDLYRQHVGRWVPQVRGWAREGEKLETRN